MMFHQFDEDHLALLKDAFLSYNWSFGNLMSKWEGGCPKLLTSEIWFVWLRDVPNS